MLIEKLKELQHIFNEERKKSEKGSQNNTAQNNKTVDTSGGYISVPSYVPSVNTYRPPN